MARIKEDTYEAWRAEKILDMAGRIMVEQVRESVPIEYNDCARDAFNAAHAVFSHWEDRGMADWVWPWYEKQGELDLDGPAF